MRHAKQWKWKQKPLKQMHVKKESKPLLNRFFFHAQLEADRIRREAEAKAERMKVEIAARKEGITYNEYQDRISRAMGYGCGVYCGD